jgi:phosphoribosylaminoimidazolecarboxamide formyltransferase/IMP cyclohydrolase
VTVAPIRRALISVHDKTGIEAFAARLAARGVELISTGGTERALRAAGLPVTDVATLTGVPEMLDGRVKTLHPRIHGGILARREDPGHRAALAEHGIAPIDLVVVNLYPFAATVRSGASADACLEQIDIGGPALIRAAAKNHADVTVLTAPDQYDPVAKQIERAGGTDLALRRQLAAAAFAHVAEYDATVAAWLAGPDEAPFPARLRLDAVRRATLRYGENPHQAGAFYALGGAPRGLAAAHQLQGKELSYNNLLDADAALALACELDGPGVVIVKHANPCGVAVAGTIAEAHRAALACDPTSAFGGIVACNRPIDQATASAIVRVFTEVVIAPDASEEARGILAGRPNLRLLLTGDAPLDAPGDLALRSVAGGLLVQTPDRARIAADDLVVVTRRSPTAEETADLLFAFTVVKHVRSNAIVLARQGATIGIGPGQPNRVDSVKIAAERARSAGLAGACVVASDAFFPFADGLEAAIAAGATAAIQPGGSQRDAEVIAAADAAGIAMVTTGRRHFRH